MKNSSSFVHDKTGLGSLQPSQTDKVIKTGQDLNNILEAFDRALNPGNYTTPVYQPVQQQPQQAGFGWGKVILLTAAAGTAIYGGKQLYDAKIKKGK